MTENSSYHNNVLRWKIFYLTLALSVVHLGYLHAAADDTKTSRETPSNAEKTEDILPRALSDLESECETIDGVLDVLRNRQTGEVYLLVHVDQLDKPFIYFTYIESGISRFRLGRGIFRDQQILKISRDYHRLRFHFEPTRYYFDPHSPLRFAANANVIPAIVAAKNIVAWDDEQTTFAVSANKLLLKELFHQIKPSEDKSGSPTTQFKLGELSADKTRFVEIRGYPKNTDVVVEYVYDNLSPTHLAEKGEGITDSRYLTITVQHSFIEAPKNDYRPRRDDPRIGYFSHQIDDMTSTSATPYRDVIHRWHLKHLDPEENQGPPEMPITWWLERSTPHEFRETIRNAVLAWNEAFLQAGFENAIEVLIQPDDADWDAGDIRYNVIRWTSSPAPAFGGYGPSFVDPRTGQILGADIMLEWVYVTNRVKYRHLFRRPPAENNRPSVYHGGSEGCLCSLAMEMQMANIFGRQVLAIRDSSSVETNKLLKQSLYYLVLHEVGHTLGLMHNFKASQLHDLTQLHDIKITAASGVTSSVMEYPNINLAPLERTQGLYYTTRPGAYDKWAITYGYTPGLDNPAEEEARLTQILAQSTRPELAFANDADDMRRPGHGIDPGAMTFDMSSDPISWAEERLQLIREVADHLLESYQESGQSYQALRDQFKTLLRQFGIAAGVVARYPGGVRIDRAFVGQNKIHQPLEPVDRKEQQRAVQVLVEHVLAPGTFVPQPELLAHLQKQRRGFDHFEVNEDFKIHDEILAIHQQLLNQLLHRNVLKRITDSSLYNNSYLLHEYLADLTRAILEADANGNVHTFRQNLQTEYVRRLIHILNTGAMSHDSTPKQAVPFDAIARSHALGQLYEIQEQIEQSLNGNGDAATTAHRNHLRWLIKKALTAEF